MSPREMEVQTGDDGGTRGLFAGWRDIPGKSGNVGGLQRFPDQ
jgi:hypothetical protein